ncbi:MAG: DsbA family protein [Deltaproteobacteria bacterium]|nr:DsbA family protein [Deltaproteobacteria bacterium]
MRKIVVLALLVSACAASQNAPAPAGDDVRATLSAQSAELAALRQEVEALKTKQKEMEEKLARPPPAPRHGPDPAAIYAFPVGDSPVRGPQDAWVTIVEVSDFQCPFCARVQPTLTALLDRYKGEVRLVFKHNPLPFHVRAMPAAVASECAREQQRFWDLHDLIFPNQREIEDKDLFAYAERAGMSVSKFRACYEKAKHRGRIEGDQKVAAALGARGTPAFFIHGRVLSGAQPETAFAALIDEELARAKASEIPRAEYYQRAVMDKGKSGM